MKTLLAAIAVGLAAAASSSYAWQHDSAPEAEIAWEAVGAFESPESAAIAHKHQAIFVSNVNGYEKNGLGFISMLALDGTIQDLQWLTGLNAPTGLTVDGDVLWAVDYDRLVKISITDQQVLEAYPAPDAEETPLLNDVAVGPNGGVFVTGSNSNSIYQLSENMLLLWIRDDEHFKYANGIWVGKDRVIVAAYHLMSVDRASKQIVPMGHQDVLFDLEGVKADADGSLYVSLIGSRPLYRLNAEGPPIPIFQTEPYLADFDVAGRKLVGPTGPNKITAWKIH